MSAEMKKTILKIINDARISAAREDRRAHADLAASIAGRTEWEKHNPDDGVGGISGCPYNPANKQETADISRKHSRYMDATYLFAVETFIDGPSDKDS